MKVTPMAMPTAVANEPIEPFAEVPEPKKARKPREKKEKVVEKPTLEAPISVPRTDDETIKSDTRKKVIVTNDMTPAQVLNYVREGADLLFDQGEKFLRLDDAMLVQFPRDVRANYHRARVFNETSRSADDVKLVQQFVVDKEFAGNAEEKLNELEVRPGLQHRWSTPAQVNARLRLGYRVATKEDAQTFLGATDGHHEVVRDGKTELVLMVRPQSLAEKARLAKEEQARHRAEQSAERGLSGIGELGARGFVDRSTKEDQEYAELAPENMQ